MTTHVDSRILATMAKLGEPAIVLAVQESKNPLGSCLGGFPVLPAGVEAPRHPETDQPLAFIGQINFGAVPSDLAVEFGLPSHGILQLFHLWADGWIEDYSEINHATLWYPEPESVSWEPASHAPTISPKRLPLAARRGHSWVSRERVAAVGGFAEEELTAFYRDVPPFHQLGGAPKIVQFDPVQLLMSVPRQSLLDRLRNQEAPPVEPWRLLWQIDSDERVNLNWIDGGLFYLLIRERDLRMGNLTNLVGNLQSP